MTDSGSLQEECTILGTPCLTLRWNTERLITLQENGGVSVLVRNNIDELKQSIGRSLVSPLTIQSGIMGRVRQLKFLKGVPGTDTKSIEHARQ